MNPQLGLFLLGGFLGLCIAAGLLLGQRLLRRYEERALLRNER